MRTKDILYVAASGAILIALWFVAKSFAPLSELTPTMSSTSTGESSNDIFEKPESTDAAGPVTIVDIQWQQGVRIGPGKIQLTQGDQLQLRITSDVDEELHLHGYERHLPLKAAITEELSLIVDRAGRFALEFHRSEAQLCSIEVYPRQN